MHEITILTEQDLRAVVALDIEAVNMIENAFAQLSEGGVIMPPILSMAMEECNGEVDIKTAYVPGLDGFAIKVSTGFFNNPALGLASLSGMMTLLDSTTGMVKAVMLDNGYLTDIRTAAAGAVAAKHLARQDAQTVGVLGAGLQARLQIKALKLVRDFSHVRIWARNSAKAHAYADEMAKDLGIDVTISASVSDVIEGSEIVVTTTPAHAPLIETSMLHSGLHITAMGSDASEKNEIHPAAIAAADLYVPDRQSQAALLGELHHAVSAGVVSNAAVFAELGEIITKRKPGRTHADQITIVDLTGTGIQDTAIADLAFNKCHAKGAGTIISA